MAQGTSELERGTDMTVGESYKDDIAPEQLKRLSRDLDNLRSTVQAQLTVTGRQDCEVTLDGKVFNEFLRVNVGTYCVVQAWHPLVADGNVWSVTIGDDGGTFDGLSCPGHVDAAVVARVVLALVTLAIDANGVQYMWCRDNDA